MVSVLSPLISPVCLPKSDLATDRIFEKNSDITISLEELKKLFIFSTSKTNYLFNGEFFDQKDGVAMGSPLGPVLANIFMGIKEQEWLRGYSGPQPEFYRSHVDDIFLFLTMKPKAISFSNTLIQGTPTTSLPRKWKYKTHSLFWTFT